MATDNRTPQPEHASPTPQAPLQPPEQAKVPPDRREKLAIWITKHYQIVVLAVAVIILAEIIWGTVVVSNYGNLISRRNDKQSHPVVKNQPVANMSLFAESLQAKKGGELVISIAIDTLDQQTDAATAVVTYDPAQVSYAGTEKGTLYTEYTEPLVDQTAGTVTISGYMDTNSYYGGKGTFAKVRFVPKTSGEASFGLRFVPEATDETTIAALGQEILGKVSGTKVLIKE